MHICRKNLCCRAVDHLTLYGTALQCVQTHKFLGVTIDHKLSWRPHIVQLKKTCYKKLNLLKMLSHKSWGADCRTLLLLYIALIKPKIDYGVEAYGSAKQHLLELLNPIQNEAIRIATGAFRSSPVKSLYAISGLKPPETYRDIKILNYAFRTIVDQ